MTARPQSARSLIRRAALPAVGAARHRQFRRLCRDRARTACMSLGRLSPRLKAERSVELAAARGGARAAASTAPTLLDPRRRRSRPRRRAGPRRARPRPARRGHHPRSTIRPTPAPPTSGADPRDSVARLLGAVLRAIEPPPSDRSRDEERACRGQGSIAEARREARPPLRRRRCPIASVPPSRSAIRPARTSCSNSTARCCSSAASRSGPASFTASA